VIKEFREFINRGNVIDLAVAVVIGAAFGRIVTSLVDGILMPPFGLVLGRVDFSSLFVVLNSSKGVPASLADAKTQGVPVIAYGAFLNEIVNFLIVAFAVFLLVKQANRWKESPPAAITRTCPFCLSDAVPIKATRCASCCADLPGSLPVT
jgi:large conductance mechanosensitive channel